MTQKTSPEKAAREERYQRRQEARERRKATVRGQQRSGQLRIGLLLAGIVLVVAGGVLATLWTAGAFSSEPPPGQKMPDLGRAHVAEGAPLTFQQYPPTSGDHYATWARAGFYEEEIPEGNWVHSLEHGYIIVLYKCPADCTELKQQLRDLYAGLPNTRYGYPKMVIALSDKINTLLALTAWNWLDELDAFDKERILRFYNTHVERGPEQAP